MTESAATGGLVDAVGDWIDEAANAGDDDYETQLARGLLACGLAFISRLQDLADEDDPRAAMLPEAWQLAVDWLRGLDLSTRPDEGALRAQFAFDLLGDHPQGERAEVIAVQALLDLPPTHPFRDDTVAIAVLRAGAARSRAERDADGEVETLGQLLKDGDLDDEEADDLDDRAVEIIGRATPYSAWRFWTCRAGHFAMRASRADQHGRRWALTALASARRAQRIAESTWPDERSVATGGDGIRSIAFEALGRLEAAAVLAERAAITRVTESAGLPDRGDLSSLVRAGVLWARAGRADRARHVLLVAIPHLRRTYTLELIDGWVQHSGQEMTLASGTLAYLDCASGDWFAGLSHLDRAKSLRLRHDLALRRSPEAEALLKSEQVAFAVARGARVVTTSLHGHDLAPDSGDVRTEYWVDPKVRMQLDMATERGADKVEVATVEPVEVARRLMADEAMLVIGLSPLGAIVCLLTDSDTDRPTIRALIPEWPLPRWQRTFEKADLAEALAILEPVVVPPLAAALRSRPLSRLWVVPHLGTHAVPFHALPVLGDVPTVHLPSMASLADFLDRPNDMASGVAVAVGDPSEDLLLAAAEPELVAEHLVHAGLTTHTYRGSSATRDAVRQHEDCVLLHFAGHSRADLLTPHRSALCLHHPAATEQLRLGHDRLADLASELTEWTEVSPGVREAVIPSAGVLREERFERGDDLVVERRLEHTAGQTVLVHRRGPGALAFDAWTAGEIAFRRDLRQCRLAVLSACEAGFGAGGAAMIDEMSGLPGALGLSGVTTVVAPLWPIPEDTGLLFTDFFYSALVEELSGPSSSTGTADVARAVHTARRRLAGLSGTEASTALRRLRSRVGDLRTKTVISLAMNARSLEPEPYSEPSQWAPFVVVGRGTIARLPEPGILNR